MTIGGLLEMSQAGPPTDVGQLWNAAVKRFEDALSIQIQDLTPARSISDVLQDIRTKDAAFKARRHDGSKTDKFRTLVNKGPGPIEQCSDILASATSTMRV